jgi:hypothetical protein
MRTEEMQKMHKELEEHQKMKIAAKDYNVWSNYIQKEYAQAENEIVKKSEAMSRQVGGTHYKDKVIQPWDVIDSLSHAEAKGFYRGNAIKYIMRAGDKGPAREDYEKAIHYLQKLLEIL